MIKAIIFDFDGVILESADIKTETFRELFSDYPGKIKRIIGYHIKNAGISRFVKFRYIYENILGEALSKEKEAMLGRRFSKVALGKVLSAPFVAGAKEFLDGNKNRYQFFVASGTPEKELRDIICRRGLRGYFKEIHGSPKNKADIIKYILKEHSFSKDEVVYIGDAEGDRLAAKEAKIAFIERQPDLHSDKKNRKRRVRDLRRIGRIIEKI